MMNDRKLAFNENRDPKLVIRVRVSFCFVCDAKTSIRSSKNDALKNVCVIFFFTFVILSLYVCVYLSSFPNFLQT